MKITKKFLPVFAVVLAFMMSLSAVAAQVEPMGANGTLTASFGGSATTPGIDTSELQARITAATNYRNETTEAANGNAIPTTSWWATQAIMNEISTAIQNAENFLTAFNTANADVRRVARGTEFTMSIGITGNTGGFANMPARITVPAGLELVGVTANFGEGWSVAFPENAQNQNPSPTTPIVGSATASATLAAFGTANNTTNANNLIVYTFRVPQTATVGITAPIVFSFENRYNETVDIRDRNDELRVISRPGPGGNGVIGRINIV